VPRRRRGAGAAAPDSRRREDRLHGGGGGAGGAQAGWASSKQGARLTGGSWNWLERLSVDRSAAPTTAAGLDGSEPSPVGGSPRLAEAGGKRSRGAGGRRPPPHSPGGRGGRGASRERVWAGDDGLVAGRRPQHPAGNVLEGAGAVSRHVGEGGAGGVCVAGRQASLDGGHARQRPPKVAPSQVGVRNDCVAACAGSGRGWVGMKVCVCVKGGGAPA
jgi:hypothetical protein